MDLLGIMVSRTATKRTAWVVARLLLADNGYRLKFDPADAVRTMETVAAGELEEAAQAEWFRQRIAP
jgi:death on curing protein